MVMSKKAFESTRKTTKTLALGTGFMEDNFSTDRGWGMVSR